MRQILLVEDDDALRTMLRRQLSRDFVVHVAAGHAEAFSLLGLLEHLDAAISDFALGKEGRGDEVLVQVRQVFPACVCVLMSGSESARVGGYDFLKKPFDPEELLQLLQNRLAEA